MCGSTTAPLSAKPAGSGPAVNNIIHRMPLPGRVRPHLPLDRYQWGERHHPLWHEVRAGGVNSIHFFPDSVVRTAGLIPSLLYFPAQTGAPSSRPRGGHPLHPYFEDIHQDIFSSPLFCGKTDTPKKIPEGGTTPPHPDPV